jgi:hypothetical protein
MTFKAKRDHRPLEERPAYIQFEAKFHQALCKALLQCSNMGNKKRQGYVMGAFREVMAEFHVSTKQKANMCVELTEEEANFAYALANDLTKAYQDALITLTSDAERERYVNAARVMSGLKVKFMVRRLMGIDNEVS